VISFQELSCNVLLSRCLLECVGTLSRCMGSAMATLGRPLRIVLMPTLERLADGSPSVTPSL